MRNFFLKFYMRFYNITQSNRISQTNLMKEHYLESTSNNGYLFTLKFNSSAQNDSPNPFSLSLSTLSIER